jgi:hypothetical protein
MSEAIWWRSIRSFRKILATRQLNVSELPQIGRYMEDAVTREQLAGKLEAYLGHRLALAALVEWAEAAMLEGVFEDEHFDAIRDVVARLGVADVRAFGLTWEDCEEVLRRLGYEARVEVTAVR